MNKDDTATEDAARRRATVAERARAVDAGLAVLQQSATHLHEIIRSLIEVELREMKEGAVGLMSEILHCRQTVGLLLARVERDAEAALEESAAAGGARPKRRRLRSAPAGDFKRPRPSRPVQYKDYA